MRVYVYAWVRLNESVAAVVCFLFFPNFLLVLIFCFPNRTSQGVNLLRCPVNHMMGGG